MRAIILTLLCLFITACAALEQQYTMFQHDAFKSTKRANYNHWVEQNCNATGAYHAGYERGLTTHQYADKNFGYRCPDNQDLLTNAYLTGYSEGVKGRSEKGSP